jgi:hypothetical protein
MRNGISVTVLRSDRRRLQVLVADHNASKSTSGARFDLAVWHVISFVPSPSALCKTISGELGRFEILGCTHSFTQKLVDEI